MAPLLGGDGLGAPAWRRLEALEALGGGFKAFFSEILVVKTYAMSNHQTFGASHFDPNSRGYSTQYIGDDQHPLWESKNSSTRV